MSVKEASENTIDVNSYNRIEDEILLENADYITVQNCPNWEQIRMNLKTAMLDYPLYKGAKKPDGKCVGNYWNQRSLLYLDPCAGLSQPV